MTGLTIHGIQSRVVNTNVVTATCLPLHSIRQMPQYGVVVLASHISPLYSGVTTVHPTSFSGLRAQRRHPQTCLRGLYIALRSRHSIWGRSLSRSICDPVGRRRLACFLTPKINPIRNHALHCCSPLREWQEQGVSELDDIHSRTLYRDPTPSLR